MGSDGGRPPFGSQPIFMTTPASYLPTTPWTCLTHPDAAENELVAITRPKAWLHRDTWSWPWVGHWYHRVVLVLGPVCIDLCRCRCRGCREHVARLREEVARAQPA